MNSDCMTAEKLKSTVLETVFIWRVHMTNAEVITNLRKMDIDEKAIQKFDEKYDMEEITRLVDGASNPKEAIDSIHKLYPELQVEELKKQCEFLAQQIKADNDPKNGEVQELTEDELSNVAGGGLFDWFDNLSEGWQTVIKGAVIGVAVTAVLLTGAAVVTVVSAPVVAMCATIGFTVGALASFDPTPKPTKL